MKEEFLRTSALVGEIGVEKLNKATVAVFGIGGVGSYAAEALVRSGIGSIYLYDNDTVSKSNINRQLIADNTTVGMYKTAVAGERYKKINPDCIVFEKCEFITPESEIPFDSFDFIVDAIDNVTAKLFLITEANKRNIPIISIMGTGNKTDPTRLKITDIYKTSVCPLAKVMRYELKKRNVKSLITVWSDEIPIKPGDFGEYKETGRIPPASMAMVPGCAGLMAAAKAVEILIK